MLLLRRACLLGAGVALLCALSAGLAVAAGAGIDSWRIAYATTELPNAWTLYEVDVDRRITVPIFSDIFFYDGLPVLSPDRRYALIYSPTDDLLLADRVTERVLQLGEGEPLVWATNSRAAIYRTAREIMRLSIAENGDVRVVRIPLPHNGRVQAWFTSPVWSPDGTSIAFKVQYPLENDTLADNHRLSEIMAVSPDGNDLRSLSRSRAMGDFDPVWSPDGRRVVFVSQRDGNAELYIVDANGDDLRRLTFAAAGDTAPAWSPDGTRLVFVSSRNGTGELYTLLPGITDNDPIPLSARADSVHPAWSPDGDQLVFVSSSTGSTELYVVDADGRNLRPLTADGVYKVLLP